ncbi:MAG: LysR family transcriptional regulator [Pseudomonadota bacterium]
MDWQKLKFDWNRARAFLVTAEEGSLSRASRALGMTQPTLSRQVSALEKELRVALFERAGKGLELTSSGTELLVHVRKMGEAANDFALTASGQSDAIEGTVCISASQTLAAHRMPEIIRKLRSTSPGIEIELVASNEESDLKRREADIAIRAYRPKQPDLIAKRLCTVGAPLYIAKSYFAELGQPESIDAFNTANFIGFGNNDFFMQLLNSKGMNLSSANFPVSSEDRLVQMEFVKQGLGIGLIPESVGDRDPGLIQVLAELGPFEADIWLVTHRELRTSRRIKTVFDFLASELS